MGLFDSLKESKKTTSAKSSARPQGVPTSRRFDAPHDFDFIYEMLMRFAATLYSPDELTISITAYSQSYDAHPAGEITLTLSSTSSLNWRREFLYKEDTSSNKGLYNLFYGNAYRSENVMRYHFNEPDCYIFSCPENLFRQETEKYCAHAYVDFYRRYANGMLTVIIKFRRISDDQVFENTKEYQRYNHVVFSL